VEAEVALREGLRTPGVADSSRRALAESIAALANPPAPEPGEAPPAAE